MFTVKIVKEDGSSTLRSWSSVDIHKKGTATFDDLMNDWEVYKNERDTIINTEMKAYNVLFKTLNIPALILDDKP